MTVFKDLAGQEWRVSLDAFTLDDVRKQTGVDLADISAGGWHQIETDAGACVRVLAVICADEIRANGRTPRQFAAAIRKDAIPAARAALLAEGADFFPPNEWSAIQSNLQKRRESRQQAMDLLTTQDVLQALTVLPPAMQIGAADAAQAIQAAFQQTKAAGGSPPSPAKASVGGQESTPSAPATGSPENVESPPGV